MFCSNWTNYRLYLCSAASGADLSAAKKMSTLRNKELDRVISITICLKNLVLYIFFAAGIRTWGQYSVLIFNYYVNRTIGQILLPLNLLHDCNFPLEVCTSSLRHTFTWISQQKKVFTIT